MRDKSAVKNSGGVSSDHHSLGERGGEKGGNSLMPEGFVGFMAGSTFACLVMVIVAACLDWRRR